MTLKSLKILSAMTSSGQIKNDFDIKCDIINFVFSMVAEIGGYSGLLIGFSMMDLAMWMKEFVDFLNKYMYYNKSK